MRKILGLIAVLVSASCNQTNEAVVDPVGRVTLTVSNLPPLEQGYYELWGTFFNFNNPSGGDSPTHEGEFVSFGKFAVGPDGSVQGLKGGAALLRIPGARNPQLLKDIVITLQYDHHDGLNKSTNTDEPGPIIIGGPFRGDAGEATADLSMAYADAFRTDFASVTGRCLLVAPSSPADSTSGVWFVESGSTLSAGLKNLPLLPGTWRYEGWVVDRDAQPNGTWYSTGKFMRADSADYDGAGPGKGPGTGYDFPGQDFITGNPSRPDLSSARYRFEITIEPFPDNAATPFFLKLFSSEHVLIPLQGRTRALMNVMRTYAPTAQIRVQR